MQINAVSWLWQLCLIDNGNVREFFAERGEFFSFKTGIPGGPDTHDTTVSNFRITGAELEFFYQDSITYFSVLCGFRILGKPQSPVTVT